jgi:hypothetical protein
MVARMSCTVSVKGMYVMGFRWVLLSLTAKKHTTWKYVLMFIMSDGGRPEYLV